jgi:hypothetical protein
VTKAVYSSPVTNYANGGFDGAEEIVSRMFHVTAVLPVH